MRPAAEECVSVGTELEGLSLLGLLDHALRTE
jgi:hypothetical protein